MRPALPAPLSWHLLLGLGLGLGLPASAGETRVVARGDTASSIAEAAGISEAELRELNGLGPDEELAPGAVVELPPGERETQIAVVWSLSGEATGQLPGKADELVPLVKGQCLPMGSRVCTGEESFAAIRLQSTADAGRFDDLSLLPGTCLTVEAASTVEGRRNAVVSVDQGAISVRADEVSPGSLTVVTRDGTIAGTSGTFRVTLEEEATRTESLTDEVQVFGGGVQVEVGPAQGNRVAEGQAPTPPVDLLPPGTPIKPLDGSVLRWTDFEWTADPDALAYQIEVALDPDFVELAYRKNITPTIWTPTVLTLPVRVEGLWWRISAFDDLGFQGMPSEVQGLTLPAGVGQ